jgi:hypothetical protein
VAAHSALPEDRHRADDKPHRCRDLRAAHARSRTDRRPPRCPSRRRHSDRAARDQRRADVQVGAGGDVCQPQLDSRAHSIQVRGLSREGLAARVEGSTHEIPTTEHRRSHQEEDDFMRWRRCGGRRPLALYGRQYFSLLASFRCQFAGSEKLPERQRRSGSNPDGRCLPRRPRQSSRW